MKRRFAITKKFQLQFDNMGVATQEINADEFVKRIEGYSLNEDNPIISVTGNEMTVTYLLEPNMEALPLPFMINKPKR
jgi:hypothetical protein